MTNDVELTIKISAGKVGVIKMLFDILDSNDSELTVGGFEAFVEHLVIRGTDVLLESLEVNK